MLRLVLGKVNTMIKKQKSTYDAFVDSLTSRQKESFDEDYKDLLVSEMLIAMMHQDNMSVRKLAEKAGISPTIIQEIRSGARTNVSMKSFVKILQGLGYDIVAERKGSRVALDFIRGAPAQKEGPSRRRLLCAIDAYFLSHNPRFFHHSSVLYSSGMRCASSGPIKPESPNSFSIISCHSSNRFSGSFDPHRGQLVMMKVG